MFPLGVHEEPPSPGNATASYWTRARSGPLERRGYWTFGPEELLDTHAPVLAKLHGSLDPMRAAMLLPGKTRASL